MRVTSIDGVEQYRVADRSVTFDCTLERESTERTAGDRTVPVTVEFLRPGSFRFHLDVNPEGKTATNPLDVDRSAVSRPVDLTVSESETHVLLETTDLRVEVGRDEWSFAVSDADGTTLLTEHRSQVGPGGAEDVEPLGFTEEEINNGSYRVTGAGTSFSLRHDEHVFGLGEKFTSIDKRGQSIDSWTVRAGGTETERSYKNVPFFLSTRGYGLLVETTDRVGFDVGESTTAALSIDVDGDAFGFAFFHGPSFETVLEQVTALTGRSRFPPTWSFGLWMSRAGYETRDQLEDVATRLRDEEIPCDVLHLDPQWMGGDRATDLEWDADRFPDPESMIDALHDDGFRVSLWEHPYVPVGTATFDEAATRGYLVDNGSGEPYVLDDLVLGQYRGGIVDFTDPAAVSWWQEKHRPLLDAGVDAFKTDFGEDVPRDAVFENGRTGASVHNLYPNLYNEAVHEVTADEKGPEDAVTWGRSAWAGGQRYPLYWGGDPEATFEGMASALRGGLSLSLSGFPFWSHDIGGFWGDPSEKLYVRWAQFGLLSSHARCHGVTPREPWQFGEEATRVFRKFARLRYRLLPYFYSLASIATRTGLPVVRPLVLEYQDDPAVYDVDDQFLLGSDLLVAPVLRADDAVDVYLPDDEWVDFWTGERFRGPETLRREVPLDSMPLFRRSESAIPTGPVSQTTDDRADELTLVVTLAETGESRAVCEIFDEAARETTEAEVYCPPDRTSLEFRIPDPDRFGTLGATVGGFGTRPESVVLNDRTLPERDGDAEAEGWTYRPGSGTVEVRT